MPETVTWILTADDWNARIHVSRDGISTLLHSVRNRNPERIGAPDRDDADFRAFEECLGLPRPRATHLCFAHELLWLLGENAQRYDGLIVMATQAMMDALTGIGAATVRDRIVARIVLSAPIANPILEKGPMPEQGPEPARAVG